MVLFGIIIGGCSGIKAQKEEKDKESQQKPSKRNKSSTSNIDYNTVYKLALGYGDYQVAIQTMYYRIAQEPSNLALRDTLASLYYMTGSYNQCVAVCNDILTQQPENAQTLQLTGQAFKKLEDYQQAANAYQQLYELTGSIYNLYEATFLKYQAGRYQECLKGVRQLEQNNQTEKEKISIQISESTEQTIPILAAVYNLKGAVYEKLNEPDKARKFYKKSLNISSDFILPEENINELDKK